MKKVGRKKENTIYKEGLPYPTMERVERKERDWFGKGRKKRDTVILH